MRDHGPFWPFSSRRPQVLPPGPRPRPSAEKVVEATAKVGAGRRGSPRGVHLRRC